MSAFTENEIAYLNDQRLGRLATQQPGGDLQNNPVGFTFNPETDTIDVSGHNMAGSQKWRNVNDNHRVSFVVDDLASVQPWRPRFLEIRGWAETVETESREVDAQGFGGPFIRIHPKRILAFGLDSLGVNTSKLAGMPVNIRSVSN